MKKIGYLYIMLLLVLLTGFIWSATVWWSPAIHGLNTWAIMALAITMFSAGTAFEMIITFVVKIRKYHKRRRDERAFSFGRLRFELTQKNIKKPNYETF